MVFFGFSVCRIGSSIWLRKYSIYIILAYIFLYLSGFFGIALTVIIFRYHLNVVHAKAILNVTDEFDCCLSIRLKLIREGIFFVSRSNVGDYDGKAAERGASLFAEATQRFPESDFLSLSYCRILFSKRNFNFCMLRLNRISQTMRLLMDSAFLISKYRKRLDDVFSKQVGTVAVQNYFMYRQFIIQSETLQKNYVLRMLNLLEELNKKNATHNLHVLILQIMDALNNLQFCNRQMFEINPDPHVIRTYASFISQILGLDAVTQKLLAEANLYEEESTKVDSAKRVAMLDQAASLFDQKNAVIVISAGKLLFIN